jgi:hypothetical protein
MYTVGDSKLRLNSIVCVTSVPPKIRRPLANGNDVGLDYLQACLQTWLETGAKLTTLNRLSEVPRLPPVPAEISRVTIEADTALYNNCYGPSLGAMADAGKGNDIVGIFNADTYLFDSAALENMLQTEAKDTLIFARRIDVETFGGALRTLNKTGVDAIFFDRERFMPMFSDPDVGIFQMGVPWWDVLVPTVASFYGDVACIDEPFVAHMEHSEAWDTNEYLRVGLLARDTMLRQAGKMAGVSAAARGFLEQYSAFLSEMRGEKDRKVLFRMKMFCWEWIWKNTRIIATPVDINSALFHSSFKASIEGRKLIPFRSDSLSADSRFLDILTTFREDSSRTIYLLFRHLETWARCKVRGKDRKQKRSM